MRRTTRIRDAILAALALTALLAIMSIDRIDAADPTPRPAPTVVGITPAPIVDWPCLADGWAAGDRWGPGPGDVVPDAPPCDAPAPAATLPPTDTEDPTDGD